jgi:hypothetical protein
MLRYFGVRRKQHLPKLPTGYRSNTPGEPPPTSVARGRNHASDLQALRPLDVHYVMVWGIPG